MKTDLSIRNICIASIKRKYSGLANWHFTRHFETETFSDIDDRYKLSDIHLNRLPISQVVINASNWTLITTRQIITCYNGVTKTMAATDVKAGIGMILRASVKLPILLEDLRLNTIDHTRSLYTREKLKICGTLKLHRNWHSFDGNNLCYNDIDETCKKSIFRNIGERVSELICY